VLAAAIYSGWGFSLLSKIFKSHINELTEKTKYLTSIEATLIKAKNK